MEFWVLSVWRVLFVERWGNGVGGGVGVMGEWLLLRVGVVWLFKGQTGWALLHTALNIGATIHHTHQHQ